MQNDHVSKTKSSELGSKFCLRKGVLSISLYLYYNDTQNLFQPSGHLTPLEEDDIENDEVVSVAIGPPPIRPKYDKIHKNKSPTKKTLTNNNVQTNIAATSLVKDVLSQLGRELLTKDVNENFVFGQYVGNSMRNLTSEQRISLQHDILELIVKYQKKEKGDHHEKFSTTPMMKEMKIERKYTGANETDENWPDFSNLEKIVG